MKVSYNWLKEFIDLNEPAEEIEGILTATGLEVEGLEPFESIKGGLRGLILGEVLTCEQHPNADKLKLTTVDLGNGDPAKIVCGAPNVEVGQKVIVAPVGATIYPSDKEEGLTLKKAKIRGEESHGMICSSYEIGLDENHTGIIVIDTQSKNGTPAADLLAVENDQVFEIGLTPNRADAASHIGVCRDLQAAMDKMVKWPDISSFKVDNQDLPIEVIVEDEEGSPRYTGITISNVTVAESPDWLKNRLLAIGLAPINNVVDITNYVLHSIGQPLHAFDYDEIKGGKVVVKTMPEGSKFVTLDEKERKLAKSDLMICNADEGMCIAGVFGGIKSGIKETTKNIFLEGAYFSPDYIRRTSQKHGLKTDASFRFERGTDPNITEFAVKWAAMLIRDITGGSISSEIIDHYPKPVAPFEVDVKYKNVDRLIGKVLDRDQIKQILTDLEIEIATETKDGFSVKVPPYRVDVKREADVIEEILRIYGYDNVELEEDLSAEYLSDFPITDKDDIQLKISELLSSRGYYEIITNSLTKPMYAEAIQSINEKESIEILNRLSEELGVMRQSLLPNGLEVIAHNVNRRQKNLKLYEFGKTYSLAKDKYKEEEILAIYLSGEKHPEHWQNEAKQAEFHDLASTITSCLQRLGIEGYETSLFENDVWSKGLELTYNKQVIGRLGFLKGDLLKLVDLQQGVLYGELFWNRLLKKSNNDIAYKEVPKYPEVRRDLSIVIDNKVTFNDIKALADKTERRLIKDINVFSVYHGENIGKDKKAYAISFILQDENQTLKDKQIDNVMKRLIQVYETELGALIRK